MENEAQKQDAPGVIPAHDIVVDEKGKPRWVMLNLKDFEKLLNKLVNLEQAKAAGKPKQASKKAASYKKMLKKLRKGS
jgi:hypothetical protein